MSWRAAWHDQPAGAWPAIKAPSGTAPRTPIPQASSVPTTRLDTMLDDTLKDYWTFVLHYRRSGAITRTALLGGFLLHQARHHRSMKVRRLLTAFIAREKGSLDDQQSR
jgi:hypothetical protein